jgi:hypothetical protein
MPDITDQYRRAAGYVDRISRARSQTTCGYAATKFKIGDQLEHRESAWLDRAEYPPCERGKVIE